MLPHHHLYGLAWGAAALLWMLCGTLALGRALQGGERGRMLALLAAATAAAITGARLHFVLLTDDPLHGATWRALLVPLDEGAGLRISGGLLAALAILLLAVPYAVRGRLARAEVLDVLVPLAGVAIAVGRLGCFADGCCFGVPCTLPWCVPFPFGSPAYWNHVAQGLLAGVRPSLRVHPVQLYLGATGLVACSAGLLARSRGARPGTPALLFVLVLSLLRAVVDTLREDSFGTGVPHQLAVDGACAGVALALLAWRCQRRDFAGTANPAGAAGAGGTAAS